MPTVISTIVSFVALARPKIICEMYSSGRVLRQADHTAVARMIADERIYIDLRPYLTAGGMNMMQPSAVPT